MKRPTLRIQKAFHSFQVVPVTSESTRIALQVMEGFSKSHGVSVPDALIAGAAIAWRAQLFTYNRKHFQPLESLGLQIHVP